jgi:hypothetical protein
MQIEIIVILIITILLSSSISSAVAYWKRNALFGTNIGEECDTDTDKIGCKLPLKCEESICRAPKNTTCKTLDDCQSPLVCDTDSMKCQPAAVTSSENINCQGDWDTNWSTCVAGETSASCGVKGSQTKQYTVNTEAKGTGTACPSVLVKSRECDLPTCNTLPTSNDTNDDDASDDDDDDYVPPPVVIPKKSLFTSCSNNNECQSNRCAGEGSGRRQYKRCMVSYR